MTLPERIERILTTKRGSRVLRPGYGSDLYLLRDRPFNQETQLLFAKYTAESIERSEPGVSVDEARLQSIDAVSGVFNYRISVYENAVKTTFEGAL